MTIEYTGIVAIGDPHLASRGLGVRKDDYPRVALEKLAWSLRYAREHALLPVLLGDVFNFPRDNANWLITNLLALLDGEVLSIYGNHDCGPIGRLTDDDTLQILVESGRLTLVSEEAPWRGRMRGRDVVVAGSSWGTFIPQAWTRDPGATVIWLTHHDITTGAYTGTLKPRELPGISLLINGHIHTPSPAVVCGQTTWMTPGNITRVARAARHIDRAPSILRIDVSFAGVAPRTVGLPHQPSSEVFHERVDATDLPDLSKSEFADRLRRRIEQRREGGVNLMRFIEAHESDLEPEVFAEIQSLATEVVSNA